MTLKSAQLMVVRTLAVLLYMHEASDDVIV
jgi:hypothetical protein